MGVDLPKMIERYSKGLEYSSTKDAYELDYGLVEVPFGRVSSSFLYSATCDMMTEGFSSISFFGKRML